MAQLQELNGNLFLLNNGRRYLVPKIGAGRFMSNIRIGNDPGDPGDGGEPGIAGAFIAPFSYNSFLLNNNASGGRSDYGARDIGKRWHDGIDFAYDGAGYGAPVKAIAPGKFVSSSYAGHPDAGPNWVALDHGVLEEGIAAGKRLFSVYWHMRARFINIGDTVESSETVIGEIGSLGNSGGPHLHLELHFDVMKSNQYSPGSSTGSQDPVPLFNAYGGWR